MIVDAGAGRAAEGCQADRDQATGTRLRAALSGSSILPSETSIRYASLVGMVFATTIVIYLRLWLDHLDSTAAYQACATRLTGLGPSLLLPGRSLERAQPLIVGMMRCGKPYATTALVWALTGVAAVAAVAAAGYRAMPWWRIRRRRLQPIARIRSADLHADLNGLVEQMGIESRPTFWLGLGASAQGVAFGRQGRCHVQLNAGLIKKYRGDRSAVTAVVMHELAHVRNRDIRYTYLTVCTWWAFVAVALLPYVVTGVLPLALGGYPQWWPAAVRASSINGRIVLSVLAMTVLIYLNYAGILRVREKHADATAASVAGADALRRVLDQSLSTDRAVPRLPRGIHRARRGWAVLRKHPSVEQRLAVLDDPAPLYSMGVAAMVGAGIAIATVQANLANLTGQILIALAGGPDMRLGHVDLMAAWFVTYGVSAWLIAVLAFVTMWRERLRTYPEPSSAASSRGWLRPAAALSAGLLVGEPLSVFFGGANVWGVFDGVGAGGAGVAGAVGAVVAVAALVFGTAVLFAWMGESATVWVPVARRSLLRIGLVASLLGTLAFGPAYASWSSFHDIGTAMTTLSYGDQLPPWVSPWKAPGMSLVYAEWLPTFVFSDLLPGFDVILALPCLFLIAGALRRPPLAVPRWLGAAGSDAAVTSSPRRSRTPVAAAMWTGLVAGLTCFALAIGLAVLVWAHTGGAYGPNGPAVAGYLIFATVTLAVALSAISAAVVVARIELVAGTLAVLAAFVTTSVVAPLSPLVFGVGLCGPSHLLTGGCRRAMTYIAPTSYGVMANIGVPRAVIAACVSGAATALLSRLTHRQKRPAYVDRPDPPHPEDARPSRLRQTVLTVLIGAVIANLALGGYFGFGLLSGW